MRCVYREWNTEMIQCMSVSAKERESWRRRGETMVDGGGLCICGRSARGLDCAIDDAE